MPDSKTKKTSDILKAVSTRLKLMALVVIVAETAMGFVVSSLDTELYKLIAFGVMALLLVVSMAYAFYELHVESRPHAQDVADVARSLRPTDMSAFSLSLKPPVLNEQISEFNMWTIEWDKNECYIEGKDFKEAVQIVRSEAGNSLKVFISESVQKKFSSEPIFELRLKDKKENYYRMGPFFVHEHSISLRPVDKQKFVADYGEV